MNHLMVVIEVLYFQRNRILRERVYSDYVVELIRTP